MLIGSTASPYVVCSNLTSNSGVNVVNSPGAIALNGWVQTAQHTITSLELKAIATSPIVLVPSQGANTIICPIFVSSRFVYGGSNVFTATNDIVIQLNGSPPAFYLPLLPTASLNDSVDSYFATSLPNPVSPYATGALDNTSLIVTSDSDATGNAANDNSLIVQVTYYVATLI